MHSALCPGDGHAPQAGALRAAAAAILRATHLLVAAGAGMSADSGLATYDAIADVRCYHDRGLSYADLCCPRLLETDPALAYGFWGSCLHSYRAAAPHAGYALVRGAGVVRLHIQRRRTLCACGFRRGACVRDARPL